MGQWARWAAAVLAVVTVSACAADTADEEEDEDVESAAEAIGAGRCSAARALESVVCFKNHDARGLYPSDHFGVMTTYEVKL